MTSTPLDLLHEKRLEQGLPDPGADAAANRGLVLKGSLIGTALLLASVVVTSLLWMRQQWLSSELDRLALVEAEVQTADRRVASARTTLNSLKRSNDALVQGLVNARSGAALLRDLQRRVPEGVQLSTVDWAPGGTSLQLSGRAASPLAFARINALQIELARSPLLDAGSIKLRKAARGDDAKDAGLVSFELTGQFRPKLPATAELRLLNELGAAGMARRMQLLQAEGLLR